jgi:nucleotide-binding universal stress UspA family protein
MFKHILIPLDGSPLAEAALPAALKLASELDSTITLVRVVRPPYVVTNVGGSTYAELVMGLRQKAIEEATAYLKAFQGSLRQQGYVVHSHVCEGESPAELILEVAEAQDIDLIVMCTHGRGGLSRWVYGSVADKVLRYAHVPVLLVRADLRRAKMQPVIATNGHVQATTEEQYQPEAAGV